MERDRATAYGALLGAQLLFATLPVAAKVGLRDLHFLAFASVRMAGAALVLLVLVHIVLGRAVPPRAELTRLAGLSVFGIVVNQVIFLWGLSLTTATNAALLLTLIPVLAYAIAVLLGHERFTTMRAGGIAVALAGVLVLLDPRDFDLSRAHLVGDLMVLVNDVSFALFLVLSRPVLRRVDPLPATAWLFAFGTLITVPAVLLFQAPVLAAAGSVPGWVWVVMAYVVLGPSVGTYVLNVFGLSRVASSTVATFIYVQPIAAVALAAVLLGEVVTAVHVLSGALVLAGVALVGRRTHGQTDGAPPAPPSS